MRARATAPMTRWTPVWPCWLSCSRRRASSSRVRVRAMVRRPIRCSWPGERVHMKYTDECGKDAETLAVLMDKAYAQGYLLTDDIIEAFPRAEAATEQLEELFAFLHGASIEVYEDETDVPATPRS